MRLKEARKARADDNDVGPGSELQLDVLAGMQRGGAVELHQRGWRRWTGRRRSAGHGEVKVRHLLTASGRREVGGEAIAAGAGKNMVRFPKALGIHFWMKVGKVTQILRDDE